MHGHYVTLVTSEAMTYTTLPHSHQVWIVKVLFSASLQIFSALTWRQVPRELSSGDSFPPEFHCNNLFTSYSSFFFCQEQLPEASENQAMYSALKECESSNLHSTVTYSLAKIVSHSNDSDASNVPEKRKQGPSRHFTRTKIVVPVGWATSPTGQLDTVPLRLRLPWNPWTEQSIFTGSASMPPMSGKITFVTLALWRGR